MARSVLFEIHSPYLRALCVVLYRDSWDIKIAKRTDFHEEWIIETVTHPANIVRGTTNPNHLAFVSGKRFSRNGSPLVVFVSEMDYPCPIVSVGFRRDFQDLRGHVVLWP